MTWLKKRSVVLTVSVLIFICIVINFFFLNVITDTIITVFVGLETLWIIIIFNEIANKDAEEPRKKAVNFISIYSSLAFIITLLVSYLLY
ncbi:MULTISPECIES: hypothetical protein [Listeria]|uniref:hypothetical protein n=1 Tax=Listeria TaxID=1637 RepID=UPI0013566812|nr:MULTISPECIES: hypothetical protein [Listeria]